MTAPTIRAVVPSDVVAGSAELLRVIGSDFATAVRLGVGTIDIPVAWTRSNDGTSVLEATLPALEPGTFDVTVTNLGANGVAEAAVAKAALTATRAPLAVESDLTRLTRQLVRLLKTAVLANTTTPVAVDYREGSLRAVPVAKIPSVVLAGPSLTENRLYAGAVIEERVVKGSFGPEIEQRRCSVPMDARYALVATSDRTSESLNLGHALVTFLHRHPYVAILRDPKAPELGTVRFELDLEGSLEADPEAEDNLRTSRGTLVVRGFPIDETDVIGRAPVLERDVVVRSRRYDR